VKNRTYIWSLVIVATIGYVLGYRIGTFDERHWPTPPPAEKEMVSCKMPMPPVWDMKP